MDKADLRTLWEYVALIAPAPIGALIGLRYATQLTPRQQAMNFMCSAVVGFFAGSLAGDLWPALSHNAVALATIVATAVSMEIMAGLVFAARTFSADPFGFVGKVLDIAARIMRRGQP